MPNTFLN